MGSPVYYYDGPENFKHWLSAIPGIEGKPVASYVAFGGQGGNQHNTACTLLALLAAKGGIPVGMAGSATCRPLPSPGLMGLWSPRSKQRQKQSRP